MIYSLKIGSKLIADITKPQPHEIDLKHVDRRLRRIVRFSDHPWGITVAQHQTLVTALVQRVARSPLDVLWAEHHDDPEGLMGDLVGPIKNHCAEKDRSFLDLEDGFAEAILHARGYVGMFGQMQAVQAERFVHRWDKMAETFEWLFIMGEEQAGWNAAWEKDDFDVFKRWFDEHGRIKGLMQTGPLRDILPMSA